VIRNDLVHHIQGQGIWLGGTGHVAEKNVIYTTGNNQEARGILISANYKTEAADCTVRGNQIYLCKKEGIRDYGGNNDSGSIFIYEFDPPVKGRSLRFNMLENFPDDGLDWTADAFVVSDVWVANLAPPSPSPPEPRSPLGRPAVSDTPAVISDVFGNIGSVLIE